MSHDRAAVLRVEIRGGIRVLTLDRPEALNAFNDDLYDAVRVALTDAANDPTTAVVVLTGAGRAFSAGQDLGEMSRPPKYSDGEPHGFVAFIETVESFPKPLLAAVNGVGVGIGLTILPHCDIVMMAEGARLRAPFVSLGVTVEAGNSVLLPARVGPQEAAHVLFTATWIDASRAVEIGLAWRAYPDDELLDAALALAAEIAAMPVESLVATKKLLVDGRLDAVRAARDREERSFAELLGSPANLAALESFAKR